MVTSKAVLIMHQQLSNNELLLPQLQGCAGLALGGQSHDGIQFQLHGFDGSVGASFEDIDVFCFFVLDLFGKMRKFFFDLYLEISKPSFDFILATSHCF